VGSVTATSRAGIVTRSRRRDIHRANRDSAILATDRVTVPARVGSRVATSSSGTATDQDRQANAADDRAQAAAMGDPARAADRSAGDSKVPACPLPEPVVRDLL